MTFNVPGCELGGGAFEVREWVIVGTGVLALLLAAEGKILNEYTLEILSLIAILLVGALTLYLNVRVALVMPGDEAR